MAETISGQGGRALVVGLLWHSRNSDNLGLGALTQSQIAILESIAAGLGMGIQFRVFGWADERAPYIVAENVVGVTVRTRTLVSPAGFYAAVRKCDLVCDICAGDSFADIYGLKRFLLCCLSKAIVPLARQPLVLSPQTIGPFRRRWTGWIARALLRRCDVVAARDDLSLVEGAV